VSATLERDELVVHWTEPPGIPGFFTTVDHKRIGMRYIYTAFFFFFVAGLMAIVMRQQLSQPDQHVIGPRLYDELFTMHGATMIFLFNTPVLAGFGNYLLPLMLGTRDMAFPRLNAFSYWIFVLSGIFMFSSFLVGRPPDGGWFAYVPLTDKAYAPGLNMDFWGLGVIFVGISTTVGAVNFAVTVFKMRAPGMSVSRLPVFVWTIVGMAFMVIFAVPALTVAAGLLEADRLFGTTFYAAAHGGSALLYQHLFWFWGHPEVYILFLPAAGMVATFVPVFAKRPLAAYLWVVTALIAIAFISFGVWVHHMFATGIPALGMSFFAAASQIIAIPNGVLFFALIATMWRGKVRFTPPMLYSLGFLLIFLLGGITGVMVAVMPFDWQAHDSYFIVAHFHYVLNGAVVFPIFGAIYYWWPKMTGRMLSDRLGKASFWVMFVGFNLAFFPMHILGLLGMPRRIYTYPEGTGWGGLNVLATVGGIVFGIGTGITLYAVWRARRHGDRASANPWDADTLEWATSSPPPHYNFKDIPVVASRHPLWEQQPLTTVPGTVARDTPVAAGLEGVLEDDAVVPEDTYLPFLVALGIAVFFFGLLVKAGLMLAIGVVVGAVGLVWWAWRTESDLA
jgi:cytochrome c oxidase subunit 1/cytochrome c oxidase subunit I+III